MALGGIKGQLRVWSGDYILGTATGLRLGAVFTTHGDGRLTARNPSPYRPGGIGCEIDLLEGCLIARTGFPVTVIEVRGYENYELGPPTRSFSFVSDRRFVLFSSAGQESFCFSD